MGIKTKNAKLRGFLERLKSKEPNMVIDLSNEVLTVSDVKELGAAIKSTKHVKKLKMRGVLNDETMKKFITYLKKSEIEELDFSNTKVDFGILFQHLEGGSVRVLNLSNTSTSGFGISRTNGFLGTLNELDLSGCGMSAYSAKVILGLQRGSINKLNLSGNKFDDEDDFRLLLHNALLYRIVSELNLSNCQISNDAMSGFRYSELYKHIRQLSKLDLSNNPFTNEGVRSLVVYLCEDDTLRELKMNNVNLFSDVSTYLPGIFRNEKLALKRLELSNTNLEEGNLHSILNSLEKNTTLEHLDISNNKIRPLVILLALKTKEKNSFRTAISSLRMANCGLDDIELLALLELFGARVNGTQKLQSLDITDNKSVSSLSARFLMKHPNVYPSLSQILVSKNGSINDNTVSSLRYYSTTRNTDPEKRVLPEFNKSQSKSYSVVAFTNAVSKQRAYQDLYCRFLKLLDEDKDNQESQQTQQRTTNPNVKQRMTQENVSLSDVDDFVLKFIRMYANEEQVRALDLKLKQGYSLTLAIPQNGFFKVKNGSGGELTMANIQCDNHVLKLAILDRARELKVVVEDTVYQKAIQEKETYERNSTPISVKYARVKTHEVEGIVLEFVRKNAKPSEVEFMDRCLKQGKPLEQCKPVGGFHYANTSNAIDLRLNSPIPGHIIEACKIADKLGITYDSEILRKAKEQLAEKNKSQDVSSTQMIQQSLQNAAPQKSVPSSQAQTSQKLKECIDRLSENDSSFTEVDLRGEALTRDQFRQFLGALTKSQYVKSIDLGRATFPVECFGSLVPLLRKKLTVKSLAIDSLNLNDTSFLKIIYMLKDTYVEKLDVSYNANITDKGAEEAKKYVGVTKIKSIDMTGTAVSYQKKSELEQLIQPTPQFEDEWAATPSDLMFK